MIFRVLSNVQFLNISAVNVLYLLWFAQDSCLNGFDVEDEALAAMLNQFRAEGGCDLVQQ